MLEEKQVFYQWEWDEEEEKKFNEYVHTLNMKMLDEEYGEENMEDW